MVDVSRTEYDVIRGLYDGCNKLSGNQKRCAMWRKTIVKYLVRVSRFQQRNEYNYDLLKDARQTCGRT